MLQRQTLVRVLLLLSVALLQLSLVVVEGKVTWTASSSGKDDPAATAPRSQKYWDENGIKRPDYAKTDAELAADGGESLAGGLSGVQFFLLIGLAAAAFMGHKFWQDQGGARLEGSSAFFKKQLTDVEQREARLARFDADMKAD
mmetsp:Transcript_14312/g.23669  ORF Transcript_14312/g.23669 Transcript_14312/m.23669 type:complete len:144 (-) Transcript_14312:124-555(-)|eukprot:CAMPEP_0119013860 /NCGR_PEP_ID=MMETSP1176-20130426/9132_1 /TAXON_ID=265551 /ORGANISM="Synedropsis recta cf, Strain CCMP1620" /LENGTH=143 /DNA_ID=CAMNT_0006966985 /DNA_START=146 /DNA_END=577 /DNA_ORIENTATION=-